MKIEVLYFEGCPNFEPTVARVREVAAELGVTAEIRGVEVRDAAETERTRFLGSPTVRVDGVDVDPDAAGRADYALACRMYAGSGVPPREMLAAALGAAPSNE